MRQQLTAVHHDVRRGREPAKPLSRALVADLAQRGTGEQAGLIGPDREAEPLDLGPLARAVEPFDVDAMELGVTEHVVRSFNWKLLVENYSENFHTPFVHPQLEGAAWDYVIDVEGGDGMWRAICPDNSDFPNPEHEPDDTDRCTACGRESLDCSKDPCPEVIADREAVMPEPPRDRMRNPSINFPQSEEEAALVLKIHRRQLDAMVARDRDLLETALDFHFRFLEDRLAKRLERPWAELFAEPRPRRRRARSSA